MSYIFPPETASGVVDGVNKTFTLSNNIFQISYVVLDGVIYTGNVAFIQGTNSFLLADAPLSLSPQVAYYDSVPSLPAGTAITVAEARSEFLKRKKDISDIDLINGTFLKWCNYINRYAYRELINIQPEQYINTTTYTWVPGVNAYALPSDFQDISPQGTGLYEINDAGVETDKRLPLTGFGSTKTGFYINSFSLTATPIPTTAKSFKLRYIPLLPELTLETENMVIPRQFSYLLMDLLDSCYTLWDEVPQDELWNDERITRTMAELVENIAPAGQVCGLPDFSAYY